MKEKPYKTNKSELSKFLEKKQKHVVDLKGNIRFADKSCIHIVHLQKIAESATEEEKARLEAAGCILEGNRVIFLKFTSLECRMRYNNLLKQDTQHNFWSGQNYSGGYWFYSIKTEGYSVGGKVYKDKTEFLLSRSELGRELL